MPGYTYGGSGYSDGTTDTSNYTTTHYVGSLPPIQFGGFTGYAVPTDRASAEPLLTGRNLNSRKIGNNTYLERHLNDITVKYHDTHVVVYRANGDIVLNSGGYQTATTKDRMNLHTTARITQTGGVWFVTWGDRVRMFFDGMVLHTDGTVT